MAVISHDRVSGVDFDIGEFVSSYDSLKEQLKEFHDVIRATDSFRRVNAYTEKNLHQFSALLNVVALMLSANMAAMTSHENPLQWEVPSVTFLCCIFVVTLCLALPEFLLVFCLSPIPFALLLTYIKNVGQKKARQVKHIVVMAVESEEDKLKKKKEKIEKAKTDLKRFMQILKELQLWMKELQEKLDFMQSLFSWEDPELTLRFLGCIFLSMLSLIIIPMSLILLTGFLLIFLYNENFMNVVSEYLSVIRVYQPKIEAVVTDEEDRYAVEWFDAADTVESDNSSYEDESSSDDESMDEMYDGNVNQNAEKRSRSFVSHLSEYRKRRQELNKGIPSRTNDFKTKEHGSCAACEVTFSSLLTRRRYCRRCGDKFCSKCCRHYVTKAALGATAPGSHGQRVLVCNDCYGKLRVTKAPD